MITDFNMFINEGHNEIDEIYLLADQVITYFGERSSVFYKELKEDDYISKNLIDMIYNPSDYKILIPFITEFELVIEFSKIDSERNVAVFMEEGEDEYEDKGSIVVNIKLEQFNKNLQICRVKYKTPNDILKNALSMTYRKVLAHELQHAYDYFRSKGKYSRNKKTDEYRKEVDERGLETNKIAQELYFKLPHEQWARFTETIEDLDFNADFKDVLNQFKSKFRKYNLLSEMEKNRLTKALYKYYDEKNDK